MKYLLLIFVILIFSCEKKEDCKKCTTTMTQSGGGMASKVVSVLTFTACDDELRVDGRVTTASSEGYTVVSKTTCK